MDKEKLTITLSKQVVEILEKISRRSLMSKEEVVRFAILNLGGEMEEIHKNKKVK